MKNKPKEPPQIAVKFANMVFVLGIVLAFFVVARYFYALFYPLDGPYPDYMLPSLYQYYFKNIIIGIIIATLFSLGLKRLSNNLKVNLSLLFFITVIAVYGFETYLELKSSQREVIAKQMGVPYDTRTRMEVLDDLRYSGVEAFPNSFPSVFIKSNGLTAKKGRIYPLGTISNSTTIFKNEAGYYPIIETDEHGFNNPKGLYIENNVDIVLTGDSFAEGVAVHSNENIGAVLRQLDFNAISFGKRGNGPLIELASLKEYAEPLKPKIVLWLYFVYDIGNLNWLSEMQSSIEVQSSILRKYLNEDDYSQNLISRQEEIDEVLKNYAYVVWEQEREGIKEKRKERIIKLLKLSKLRSMINLTHDKEDYKNRKRLLTTATPIFRDILQKSKQMVSGWDGKMYLVYLPAFERYSTGNEHPKRDFVMSTATELNIPIIDIRSKVFDAHPDPLSLFPFRMSGHYNAEGYRLVAEAIGKRLEADGFFH